MSTPPSSTQLTIVLGMAAILLLAGCTGHEPRSAGQARDSTLETTEQPPPATRGRSAGEQAAVVAVRQVGVPYRYGGNDLTGFDCSGLVQYAYAAAGKELPRTTGGLWQQMQPVSGGNLEVGDVLFFDIEGKVSHVGLYLGSRRFVHAPASGSEVTIADLDSDFYRNAFIRGGRPR
jgi:cell wall-associated NlpC family hydrolase